MKHVNDRRLLALACAVASVFTVAACGDRSDRSADSKSSAGPPPTTSTPANTAAPTSAIPATASTPGTPSTATAAAPGTTVAASDREFIALATSSHMLEVESGQMALEKSKNSSIRAFAQHMVDDHAKTSAELRELATSVGAAPPAAMAPPHAAHLQKLGALDGAEFDREYAAQVGVAAHQEAVALFERASREAANADVRGFTDKTLPDLRKHLQEGQTLAKNLGVPADRLKIANAPPDLSSLSAMVPASKSPPTTSTGAATATK